MPPKKRVPAPIDRPLSRAYLRQFTGWSTAYPPGISQPTSLRIMENVEVKRDGAVGLRPALKYLSYIVEDYGHGVTGETVFPFQIIGTHEVFFLDDGTKAYLFAALVPISSGGPDPVFTDEVRFFVARYTGEEAHPFLCSAAEDYFTSSRDDHGPMDPAVVTFTSATTYIKYLQIDNKIVALSNAGEGALIFYVGAVRSAIKASPLPGPTTIDPDHFDIPNVFPADHTWITGSQDVSTGAGTPLLTATTLISSTQADNDYTFNVFYTYANEFGESKASGISSTQVQRPWSGWFMVAPSLLGEPTGTPVQPDQAVDQLLVVVDEDAYDANKAAGATHLNVYVASYGPSDPKPVEAIQVASKEIVGLDYAHGGFVSVTAAVPLFTRTAAMPNAINRHDYSAPPTGGQGLVAADRLIIVRDPVSPAVIRWTSNEQGNYLDFSPTRGGGYKTLTSGNLFLPACVKLWQNPQSADTLTILCQGVDGHSTGYYMAPAQVASQSEATNVMGFEETTATEGTTSPYGCEVAINALYHPLDTQLMKSTATNYNINHKSMTDLIADQWAKLINKQNIVSCFYDNRLYYIVHNPDGVALEDGCMGNEIWVLDIQAKTPTWSRWLVQAISMRQVEVFGRNHLSVVRPDGIFYFDENAHIDEFVQSGETPSLAERPIYWRLETNTQGANRAHDAMAHLQQMNVQVGNFTGSMVVGLRGRDMHGQPVLLEKTIRDDAAAGDAPWDLQDYLLVERDMSEWFFFANSATLGEGAIQPCSGQINLVQYRYTPTTVNVGYEWGSVETFEYGRAGNTVDDRTTDNGVPMPFTDTGRP